MMKKCVSILTALLLSLSAFLSGCSEKNPDAAPAPGGSPANEAVPAAAAPEEETEAPDRFAGTDFGGRTFRVYTSVDEMDATNGNAFIAGSGELNGESVNDAVYERNELVSELLNIRYDFIEANFTYDNSESGIKTQLLAGADEWDVIVNDIKSLAAIARDGLIHNQYRNEIFDLTQKYWYADAMRDCEFVEGGRYLLIGDYFTDALASTHTLYVNRDLLNNYTNDKSAVDRTVFEGKWTFDAMISLMETCTEDLNGDGELAEGDQFGFTCIGMWGSMIPFLIGTDIRFVEKTADGVEFCFDNERSVTILEMLNKLFYSKGALTTLSDYTTAGLRRAFADRLTLILGYNRLGDLVNMRDIEFSVGLAPYPKLDETQAEYVSSMHNTSEVGVIPLTLPVADLGFSETCLEVLCRETGRTVIPKYYEEGLKIKYVNGQDDARMVDLIHDTVTNPFPVAYDKPLNNFLLMTCFSTPLTAKSTDFASAYAKNIKPAQKLLDKTLEAFRENLENGN